MGANLGFLFFNDMYNITDEKIESNKDVIGTLLNRKVTADVDELDARRHQPMLHCR